MTEEAFNQNKQELESLLIEWSTKPNLSIEEKESIDWLLKLLREYTFANRLQTKGVMTRIKIDSLVVDNFFGDKIHDFDDAIS